MKIFKILLLLFISLSISSQNITINTNDVSKHDINIGQISNTAYIYNTFTFNEYYVIWQNNSMYETFTVNQIERETIENSTYKCISNSGKRYTFYIRSSLIAIGVDDEVNTLYVFNTYSKY